MHLNVGPTRADSLEGVEKIELPSGSVLLQAVRSALYVRELLSYRTTYRPMLKSLNFSAGAHELMWIPSCPICFLEELYGLHRPMNNQILYCQDDLIRARNPAW